VPVSAITDGTSNTALFSETKRGYATTTQTINGFIGGIPPTDPLNVYVVSSNDNFNPPQCTYLGPGYYTRIIYRGQEYYRNLPQTGYYSHTMTPNNRWWDCGINSSAFAQSHNAARSYHPGGVHVAFADGSVKFIKDSVSINPWRALGTRSGGEAISSDSY
jgi:prepilin-type processing-associated H-X9-DG protein